MINPFDSFFPIHHGLDQRSAKDALKRPNQSSFSEFLAQVFEIAPRHGGNNSL